MQTASANSKTFPNLRALPGYKAKGCFTEIIQFQCRLFVPVSTANDIVKALAA